MYRGSTMRPTRGFIDELYRERVLRARATPPEEKLFAGPDLFEFACSTTRAGIRDQFPGADDEEIEQILQQRLDLMHRLERTG